MQEKKKNNHGKLFIVATPIGNLGDISFRAVETLKQSDYILCEDTRHSIKLLQHYQIEKTLISYHTHNEHQKTQQIISDISRHQKRVCLITDAGTPSISDPGYLLIHHCIKENISIEYLPGASAFLAALVLSGFPSHSFVFLGFLPQKKGRSKAIQQLSEDKTIILYESPHRIIQLLNELLIHLGDGKEIALVKEITKINESVYRGRISEILALLHEKNIKGEFVVVIKGN